MVELHRICPASKECLPGVKRIHDLDVIDECLHGLVGFELFLVFAFPYFLDDPPVLS